MSKIYIVGHDDGRRVYEHSKLPRFYVKSEPLQRPGAAPVPYQKQERGGKGL